MTDSPATCPDCQTELAPRLVACPVCGRLIHGDRLRALAQEAEEATAKGNLTAALEAWRHALDLLTGPITPNRHHRGKSRRSEPTSGCRRGREASDPETSLWAQGGGVIAAIGLALWKFKFILGFIVTKGKILLLGLTKSSTLFSMIFGSRHLLGKSGDGISRRRLGGRDLYS